MLNSAGQLGCKFPIRAAGYLSGLLVTHIYVPKKQNDPADIGSISTRRLCRWLNIGPLYLLL